MKTIAQLLDMVKNAKIILIIFFSFFITNSKAQDRIPQEGEVIQFYPITENVTKIISGFDCFYSLEKAIKQKEDINNFSSINENTKFSFSTKNRYKNQKSLTPYNEILTDSFIVNKNILTKKKDGITLILILTKLSNNDKLILRVPCYEEERSNLITKSMLIKSRNHFGMSSIFVNIPFINLKMIKEIESTYENTEIMYDPSFDADDFSVRDSRAKDLSIIINSINNSNKDFLHYDVIYKSESVKFIQTHPDMVFMQPCIKLTREDNIQSYIPLTYLVGNSSLYDHSDGCFSFLENFFKTRNEYVLEEFKRNKCSKFIDKFVGQKVFYGVNKTINTEPLYNNNVLDIINITTKERYSLEKEHVYTCTDYDILESISRTGMHIPFMILKDSKGEVFRVPCSMMYTYPKKLTNFDDFFMLEDEAQKLIALRKQKESSLYKKKEILKKELSKTYGLTYANFLINYEDSTIERFKGLSRKYGKFNAKKIIEEEVCIGWNEDMCIESIGHPTDINTTEGSWGIHEQWVYETSYSTKYLYFENGKLTSIQYY